MLIDTMDKLREVIPDLLLEPRPTVDTETTGLNPWGTLDRDPDTIVGISIATAREAYYFPFGHYPGRNLPEEAWDFFRSYLSNPDRIYGGHNYKFDMHFLKQAGVEYPNLIEDSMLSAHLLNENEETFALKPLSDKYLGEGSSLEESILLEKIRAQGAGGGKAEMWRLPAEDVEPYACDDVRLCRRLLELHRPALEYWGLGEIFKQVNYYEIITARMEYRGLLLDLDRMRGLEEQAREEILKAERVLKEKAGYAVNVNSSKQVTALLGTENARAETLEILAEEGGERGDLAWAVLDLKGWGSVESKYYTPYRKKVDRDHVLRTSFNLHGTVSGRLSSTNPNLQAVARKTEVFRVKDVFQARPGYTLVSMDYSQAEMRLATYYAQEKTMEAIIDAGEDMHSATARELGIPRNAAKRINFGVIYGIGAGALSEGLRIPRKTASEYLSKYHSLYPGFRALMNTTEAMAEEKGYIRMWTGRMRHYDERNPSHKAMSNLIQGGVAEMMRVAITRAYPIVQDLGAYMVLQVHDQVMYEVPDDRVDLAIRVLKANMEDFPFHPKMEVETAIGKYWGELEVVE